MATVAELQAEIQRQDGGLVPAPQLGSPAQMSPPARLTWLRTALTELSLPTDFLSAAEALVERARALRAEAVTASQQAAARRSAALNTLGRDQAATLAEAVAQWQGQSPWLDTQPDHQRPPALEIAETGARAIESNIVGQLMNHAPRLWGLAQKKAAEIVAEVAALPPMPAQLWQVSDVAGEFARFSAHKSTYGTLTAAYRDFNLAHSIANVVRDQLGYGYERFPMGAPRTALWLKNWRKELVDDGTFARQPGALRLPYAIAKGFEPGLYAPRDVEDSTAQDKSFQGRLKNLGIAAGVPVSFPDNL
jgi:hypothetical protein